MKQFIIFALLIIFLESCMSNVDIKTEKSNLMNLDKEFSEYCTEKGATEAFKKYFAKDATQLTSKGSFIGVNAIYENMKKFEELYSMQWTPKNADVSVAGDIGYTWGTYIVFVKDSDEEITGKYLSVWKKQPSGHWKITIDIGNKDSE